MYTIHFPTVTLWLSCVASAGGACTGEVGSAEDGFSDPLGGTPGANKPSGPRSDLVPTGQDNGPPVVGPSAPPPLVPGVTPAVMVPPGSALPDLPSGPSGAPTLKRLTRREYDNTIRDLLKDNSRPAIIIYSPWGGFPADGFSESGFLTANPVSNFDVQLFMEASESLAKRAVRDKILTSLFSCSPATMGEEPCAQQFVTGFARRAFRRPLGADETADLMGLFKTARATLGDDFPNALGFVVQAILQSPSFIYHREFGPGKPVISKGMAKLDGHQVASRLSYFIWGSMPDQALFAAADAGDLSTREQVLAQAKRMLADKATTDSFEMFYKQWLGITFAEDDGKTPDMDRKLSELRLFVANTTMEVDGKLTTLLTAPYTFADSTLATKYYKMPAPAAKGYAKLDLNPAQRAGLLTQPFFLTGLLDPNVPRDTKPPVRGNYVWRSLLCGDLPAPPNVVPSVKSPSPGLTGRARFTEHAKAACASCHKILDPIGFAFENYDWMGVYRDQDQGVPIDASGSITLPSGKVITFKNAPELLRGLAATEETATCMARQWYRFATGHRETMFDARSLKEVTDAFTKSGNNLKELILAIPQTEAFLNRAALPGEGN